MITTLATPKAPLLTEAKLPETNLRPMSVAVETPRMLLRGVDERDQDAVMKLYGDPKLMRYIGAPMDEERVAKTIARWQETWRDRGAFCGMIVDRASGEPVGIGGLFRSSMPQFRNSYEVGYIFGDRLALRSGLIPRYSVEGVS